ncbi:MAG: hypothetical protein ACPGVU_24735 [Limisphaerales bacterium]
MASPSSPGLPKRGLSYRIRYTPIVPASTNDWHTLAGDVTATTNQAQKIDGPLSGISRRIYRLDALP